jgi:hypothetical protein
VPLRAVAGDVATGCGVRAAVAVVRDAVGPPAGTGFGADVGDIAAGACRTVGEEAAAEVVVDVPDDVDGDPGVAASPHSTDTTSATGPDTRASTGVSTGASTGAGSSASGCPGLPCTDPPQASGTIGSSTAAPAGAVPTRAEHSRAVPVSHRTRRRIRMICSLDRLMD